MKLRIKELVVNGHPMNG